MNEEIKNVVENCESQESKEMRKFLKPVICVGAAAGLVGAAVVLLRKNKHKIYDLMAKKLNKEGYTILFPVSDDDIDIDFDPFADMHPDEAE